MREGGKKGSCVIRMLHGWIGEEVREGRTEVGKEGGRMHSMIDKNIIL